MENFQLKIKKEENRKSENRKICFILFEDDVCLSSKKLTGWDHILRKAKVKTLVPCFSKEFLFSKCQKEEELENKFQRIHKE